MKFTDRAKLTSKMSKVGILVYFRYRLEECEGIAVAAMLFLT